MLQEFHKELNARAVAYINVDIAVQGNHTFRGFGVYSLSDLVFEASKIVDNPDPEEIADGRKTVYDTWIANQPSSRFSSRPR